MKFTPVAILSVGLLGYSQAFSPSSAFLASTRGLNTEYKNNVGLSMVLEKPKKLAKIEQLKVESEHLIQPLKDVSKINKKDTSTLFNSVTESAFPFSDCSFSH
mmetsp:Transcript_39447/g.59679  ORF Transcript_39447/g.59679 Transcript_39447/m.59679 type:complete len:103 (-) Transcript_39447:2066-2374(-)